MLQMLCEECSHFLEIAEAIRSLGLTILNGASEARGEKTCMCFVVEVGSEDRFISYSVKSARCIVIVFVIIHRINGNMQYVVKLLCIMMIHG